MLQVVRAKIITSEIRFVTVSEVEFDKVSLTLDGKEVINNLSFSTGRGIQFILGPNGAGKTVTNKLLALVYQPESGEIRWDGRVVNPSISDEISTSDRRQIGMVWQNPTFLNTSTSRNIDLPLRIRGVSREVRVKLLDKWLKLIEMEEYRDNKPQKMSIGQQQRISLARSLIYEPSIVIFDEPTSSLDPSSRAFFEQIITNEIDDGSKIIIWNTHDIQQVRRLAKQVIVMFEGEVLENGNKAQILNSSNDRVKRFINGELN